MNDGLEVHTELAGRKRHTQIMDEANSALGRKLQGVREVTESAAPHVLGGVHRLISILQ